MDLEQEDWYEQYLADENGIILDVRTEEECNEGILPSAILIDIYKGDAFVTEVDALDKTKNYYVYCRSGVRSAKACSIMNELGFENTYNLIGGFINWEGDVTMPD